MKKCKKCGVTKSLEDYYRANGMKDGLASECKSCVKIKERNRVSILRNDIVWLEKERLRCRNKQRKSPKYIRDPEKLRAKYLSYNAAYPEKQLSRNATRNMIVECGCQNHHWSYNEEHYRDIISLTVRDHNKAHRYMVYDQERFMYRRSTDNVLLDTKEVHQDWINHILENFI